jgi:hypothetical protein
LSGYKTYIVAILTAIVTLLHSLGYIDEALFQTLLALLGAGAITTVSAKINGIKADVKANEANRVATNIANNIK